MLPPDLQQQIIDYLRSEDYRPQRIAELALAMGVGAGVQDDFHAVCKELMRAGRIVLGTGEAVTLPPPTGRIIGSYRGTTQGFGFVIPQTPNSHGDLFVPPGKTGGAVTGDTVAAKVKKSGKRAGKMRYEGEITTIVQRGQSRFVGELRRRINRWIVTPEGNTLHTPIFVGDPTAKGAQEGDQVVIEITQYPRAGIEGNGVIVSILGPHGEPDTDTASIIQQYDLPGEFPTAVQDSARRIVAAYDADKEAAGREDLRSLPVLTIDPTDARDFDDAISLKSMPRGRTELGVHIADVAHFVRHGEPLDVEAKARGNSAYLPNRVIPMLPEVLSNGLCSLQEQQDRLCKSAFITYNGKGEVVSCRFASSIIRSTKRLTYSQVNRFLDGDTSQLSETVIGLLSEMVKLAKRIRRRRLAEGMLVLDVPDTELIFAGDGRMVDVQPADTSFSHTIIEMFMVEANEAVARMLADEGLPAIRRIHEKPKLEAWRNMRRFLQFFGYELPAEIDRHAIQTALDTARKKPEAFAIHLSALRSMQQAVYSPRMSGHYALASEHYCHFTSPIRRYPDLTIHRLIDRHLAGKRRSPKKKTRPIDAEAVLDVANHCSDRERRAESAERELKQVFVLRLLQKRIGDRFQGTVTGIANFGLFVQIERYLLEGLIRFDELGDDWWEIDASRGAVMGERTGRRIRLGDAMKVAITAVDIPSRRLELTPIDLPKVSTTGSKKGKKPAATKKRKLVQRKSSDRKPGKPDKPQKTEGGSHVQKRKKKTHRKGKGKSRSRRK